MIEARFDDLLAGAERAFRLVEPVGVIEARRPARSPARSTRRVGGLPGLWAAGFVAYEAAPGLDPELSVRVRAPDDPFAELPLAWFALFERKEDLPAARTRTARPVRIAGFTLAPERRSRDLRCGRRTHPRADRGRTHLPGEPHDPAPGHDPGDERGFYRDLCLAQRGGYAAFLDLGRFRVLSASPELFFRIDGS